MSVVFPTFEPTDFWDFRLTNHTDGMQLFFPFICLMVHFLVSEAMHRSLKAHVMRPVATAAVCLGLGASFSSAAPMSQLDAGIGRFSSALDSLVDLNSNWDSKVKGDPDNVRRVLGTVYTQTGCTKPLCGFDAFVRNYAKDHIDDIEDIEEVVKEFLTTLFRYFNPAPTFLLTSPSHFLVRYPIP
jgi:hypothetical protein